MKLGRIAQHAVAMLVGIILGWLATVVVFLILITFDPEFGESSANVAEGAQPGDATVGQYLVSEFAFSFEFSAAIFNPWFALTIGAVAISVAFGSFLGVFAMRRLLPERSRAELRTLIVIACQTPLALGPALLSYKLYGMGVSLLLAVPAFIGSALGGYLAYNFRRGEEL